MKLHKEGTATILIAAAAFVGINILSYLFVQNTLAKEIILIVTGVMLLFLTSFFRSPRRRPTRHDGAIVSPCDGTVVVIEETDEPEILKTRCLQVSIFMQVTNVHINWYPVSGVVKYFRHHNGRFQAPYLPKSSTENERTSVLIERPNGQKILVRQVAGALARRIVTYAEEGKKVRQSDQMGFIKFGSRVDLYLPLGTKIDATLKQSVVGSQSIIGWLN